jgi:hypothetical protein
MTIFKKLNSYKSNNSIRRKFPIRTEIKVEKNLIFRI